MAFLSTLVVAGILAATSTRPDSASSGSGRTVPVFRLPDLRDPATRLRLDQFRGRPTVLNFWASWCVPCRQEMPALESVYKHFGGRIAFVGVDHEDTRDDARKFVRKTGVDYPIGFDPDGTTARSMGLVGIPTTILLDARGREVQRHLGKFSRSNLQQLLERLFPDAAKPRERTRARPQSSEARHP